MPKLTWISDADLTKAVGSLLGIAQGAKANAIANFGKNVVDPFSALFEMSGFNLDFTNWVVTEQSRQAQKTLQNFIGDFHQITLGSCAGWVNLHVGNIVDLVNNNTHVVAEVKNKHNTISGGQLANLYYSLESAVMDKMSVYKNYTAYHVVIIPSEPLRYNKEFTPSDKKKGQKCPANALIRQIDGASFYELVTGSKTALEDLFDAIPVVIKEITGADTLDKPRLKALFKMAYG